MTGIEILAEYTAGGMPVGGIVTFSILAVLGLIIFLAGCVCGDDDVPGAGCIVIVVSLAMLFLINFTAEPEYTRYKVTISEDVKLVEFLEQYEILDTEGEIYTIREVNEE
jgi:hypothetical protein